MDLLGAITSRYHLATNSQQKQFRTVHSRTKHYIEFCESQLELDPTLVQLTYPMQTAIAIIYCSYLTKGHTIQGYRVQYPTLKGYMDAMANYVKKFVGRDVRLQPHQGAPQYMWQTHPLIEAICKDTKEWQGIPNRQDPITHAMIEYLRE